MLNAAAALIVFSAVSISEGIYLVLAGGAHPPMPVRPHVIMGGASLLVLGGVKLFGGVSLLYYSRMGAQMVLSAIVSDLAIILVMGFTQLLLIYVPLAGLVVSLLIRCWRYLV